MTKTYKLSELMENVHKLYERKEITVGEYIQIQLLTELVSMVKKALS